MEDQIKGLLDRLAKHRGLDKFDPELRTEMATRGRAAVLHDFSWDRFQYVVDQAVTPLLKSNGSQPAAA